MVNRLFGRSSSGTSAERAAIRLDAVSKVYGRGASAVHALRDVSLTLGAGTFTAVMGPSGCGKSTLLHCAAGLDRPTSGRIWLGDVEISKLNERQRTELRREHIGFVFQAFNLLPALTAEENITLPILLAGHTPDAVAVADVLARVELTEQRNRRPSALSGGQQQRVAIARALVTRPEVVFADEPTGALDLRSGRDVLELFRTAASTLGQTIVMVTHDPRAASYADAVLFMADGQLVGEIPRSSPEHIATELTRITGAPNPAC